MHISHKSFTQWHAINNVNVSMIWIVIIIIYESIYWNPMRTGNFTWRTWLEYFRLIENAFTSIFMDFRTWASKLCKLTELNLWAVFGLWVGLMTSDSESGEKTDWCSYHQFFSTKGLTPDMAYMGQGQIVLEQVEIFKIY